jgi:hypothetical protein
VSIVGRLSLGAVLAAIAVGASAAWASPATGTQARATTLARAINLRQSDLPGASEHPYPLTAAALRDVTKIVKCAHGVLPREALVISQAPRFTGDGLGGTPIVSSIVQIWRSAGFALHALRSIPPRRRIPCFDEFFGAVLRAREPNGVSVSLHGVPFPLVVEGSDGTFADRITVTVHGQPADQQLAPMQRSSAVSDTEYIDQFGFVYGQVSVSMVVQTIDVTPSRALEQHLANLLLARTRNALASNPNPH